MSGRKRHAPSLQISNSSDGPSIVSTLIQKIPCCFACRYLSSKPKKQKTPRIHNLNANENIYLLRLIKDFWYQIKTMHWLQWSWLILNFLFAILIIGLLLAHVVTYIFSKKFEDLVKFVNQEAKGSPKSSAEIFLTEDVFFYFVIVLFAVFCECLFAFIVVWYERAVSLIFGYLPSSYFVMYRIILMLVDNPTPYLITMAAVKAVGLLLFSLHALALPRTFGWKTFNTVGGIEKNMFYYRHWEIISATWLSDLQYTLMIVVLALIFIEYSWWFLMLLLLSAAVNVALVAVHKWIVQREIRILLLFSFLWNFILPVYFIYKVIMIVSGSHRAEVEVNLPKQDGSFNKNVLMRIINICSMVFIFVCSRVVLNLFIAFHFFFMNGNLRQIFNEKFRIRREKRLAEREERKKLRLESGEANTLSDKLWEVRDAGMDILLSCLGRIRYKSFGIVYVEPKLTKAADGADGTQDVEMSDKEKQPTNEPRV